MSDYNSLKAAINANIRKNGRQEITGQVLNGILRAMVDALGAGFTFRAVASPDTDPGSTDSRVFYIATIPGTYEYMGGVEIEEGEVAILKFYDDEWHKEPTGLASQAALESLGDTLGTAIGEKMTFCELWCDGDKITRKDSQIALGFVEVKELMDDPSQFVALKYIDVFWMLPQYDDEGGAIIFTGVSLMSAQGDLWRVAINEENQISDYSIAIENQYLKTDDLGDEQRDNFKTYPTTQAVNAALNDKVDKVPGKGLSANDFTTQEKNKLAGLNNYDDTELRRQVQSGVTAASGSAAQAAASAASAESKYAGILQVMENLPDGSAVSAQVALNTQKVTELESQLLNKTDGMTVAAKMAGYAIYPAGNQTTSSKCDVYDIGNAGYSTIKVKVGGGVTSFLSLAFYSENPRSQASFMSGVAMTYAQTREISMTIPEGCKVISVVNRKDYLAVPTIELTSTLNKTVSSNTQRIDSIEDELKNKTDIVSLNNPIETVQKLTQLKFVGGISSTNPKPLVLMHFSDIHGGNTETRYVINKTILERIVTYKNVYSQYIDDILCTGDTCFNTYSDRLPNGDTPNWWDLVDGSENIMVAIGNHDTSIDGLTWSSVPQADVCNTFIEPYADNWNVVRPSGKTYYYKDYATQGIRLIVIDPYYSDDAELTWFSDALNTTNHIIVAMHPPFNNSNLLDCSFNSLRWNGTFTQHVPYQQYVDAVTTFIKNGGNFVCWLHGHVHGDVTSVYEHEGTRQLIIGAPSAKAPRNASTTSESNNCDVRILNTKSMDSFNVVGVNTEYHTLTIMRVGSDNDVALRHRGVCAIDYKNCKVMFNN